MPARGHIDVRSLGNFAPRRFVLSFCTLTNDLICKPLASVLPLVELSVSLFFHGGSELQWRKPHKRLCGRLEISHPQKNTATTSSARSSNLSRASSETNVMLVFSLKPEHSIRLQLYAHPKRVTSPNTAQQNLLVNFYLWSCAKLIVTL